nr:hypothetical protein FVER53263_01845 [Fusarium verticillioides]
MMLCAQSENPYQVVYSPAFRCNSTKYLGVTFKVCDKDKLPHEPGFWLNDINNVAMDDAPSEIEASETMSTRMMTAILDLWHPVEGLEDLGHRWKRFSSTVLHNAVLWGDYTQQPYLAIMSAQAEAYYPDILHLYSHLFPQDLINYDQDVNAGSEESGEDAEFVNDGSPGVRSLDMDMGSGDDGSDDGSDDESVCLSVIEVMNIDSSLDDSDYEP